MTYEEVEFEEKLQISALSDGCIYGIKLQLGSGSAFYNHNFFSCLSFFHSVPSKFARHYECARMHEPRERVRGERGDFTADKC